MALCCSHNNAPLCSWRVIASTMNKEAPVLNYPIWKREQVCTCALGELGVWACSRRGTLLSSLLWLALTLLLVAPGASS